MWSNVEDQLAVLLSTEVFQTLMQDEAYVQLFRKAGLPGRIPSDIGLLPPKQKEQLREAARMTAQLVTMHVEGGSSLRERRAKAVVLEGPMKMFRLWNSDRPFSKNGSWWFTKGLLDMAMDAGRGNRKTTLDFLRNALAVPLDWSKCDRIAQLTLSPTNTVPAVEAQGLPMPVYSKDALRNDPSIPLMDYFAKRREQLEGMKTQYFLPFVPPTRIADLW